MKDRVSKYPGRVKMFPVDGQANTFDMVRADAPEQAGTPLNKQTFLTDGVASKYGLGEHATPNNVFDELSNLVGADFVNKNVWLATQHTPASAQIELGEQQEEIVYRAGGAAYDDGGVVYVATSVSATLGGAVIPDFVEMHSLMADGDSGLADKYWSATADFGSVFYTPKGATTRSEVLGIDGEEEFFIYVQAAPVYSRVSEETSGEKSVLYGMPGAYPTNGYAENPDAAPFAGYIYLGIGPFKNFPLFIGTGGGSGTSNQVLLARIEDLEARVAALEENGGGSTPPNGDDTEYPEVVVFLVNGVSYTVPKGMTWAELLASNDCPMGDMDGSGEMSPWYFGTTANGSTFIFVGGGGGVPMGIVVPGRYATIEPGEYDVVYWDGE